MSRRQRAVHFFRRHRIASIIVGHMLVLTVLCSVWLASAYGPNLSNIFAQPCAASDTTHVVASGDTLGAIARRYGTGWQHLADYNNLANPNLIHINQHICIPGNGNNDGFSQPGGGPIMGSNNLFPYGQCTWWGNQRYFQLHGVFIPWRTQSNAWQWSDRAREFGWYVSDTPRYGSIINLQPWVQGTWGLGHVAIVEDVRADGSVLTSNMNWAATYVGEVTHAVFWPGPGVTFIASF